MPFICYEPKRFSPAHQTVIDQAAQIAQSYRAQGYDLTLRQLYYQFVSRAWIPNTEQSYKRLGSIINDARLAGELDWDWMRDRTRSTAIPYFTTGTVGDLMRQAAGGFTANRWKGQEYWVEVWVEKEALAGVIQRPADRLDVAWMSCRGYMSQSTQWEAARRLKRKIEGGKKVLILHLGDHDPSGVDMSRDNADRLVNFLAHDLDTEPEYLLDDEQFELRRIALTMDQIRQYNPPPNPAKITDSRAMGENGYIATYGSQSWELDALEPAVLDALIDDHIRTVLDIDLYNEQIEFENQMIARAEAMMEAHGHELDDGYEPEEDDE